MKNIKNIFYAGLLVLGIISFTACSDEETYDFPGDPYNRVYIPDNSGSYKIIQTPISSISNLEFETILKCTQKASENIKATVEVDNSLIAAYNEEHGTHYEAIPAAALVIENAIMNIPAGAMATTDTLRLTTTENKDIISTLKSQNGYLIPLRLTTTEGGDSRPSTNVFSIYLTVTVTEDNVNHDAVEEDITGALVSDQTGWSATTNGRVNTWNDPIETLFDGDMSTLCNISNSEDIKLDINMGKAYTFDAITLSYGYSWGGEYGSLSEGTVIYTSSDGISWQSAGETTNGTSKFCVFYAPVTSQYIRLVMPVNNSFGYVRAGIFNVYAK
ncbi:MAG TPA: carbohydrate-binding protein [Porphyromonadaceae bacterium]|nr:carbohydrate-binding protein [Porphyromonadaceae bacterium]HBX19708.1 carbohydrate-binding protein [Porphyromonadaceae bacterium]